nr:uncharacterized protein LOC120966936 [Aegilops tauschii subsp. strangulata]
MAAGSLMRLVRIVCGSPTPDASLSMAVRSQGRARRVALSASGSSWMCAISMAATAKVCRSPWPSYNRPRRRRVCAGTKGVCWNQLVYVLQGQCLTGGSYIQRRGVLHPTPFDVGELQPCTPELQPTTGGAARGVAAFCPCFFFCRTNFLFLLEPMYFFAGTEMIFCFIGVELSNAHLVFDGT